MRHIAAHFVFDGKIVYRFALITIDELNRFVSLATMPLQETAGVEFYTGILVSLSLPDNVNENPENLLKQCLGLTSLDGVAVSNLSPWITPFSQEKPCTVFLVENADLSTVTLTEKTKIRRLV